MDVKTPIDIKVAVEGLGGVPQIFYNMLGKFEDMTLNEHMQKIIPEFEANKYNDMMLTAHSLKGACGYIGASRLHYVCWFI